MGIVSPGGPLNGGAPPLASGGSVIGGVSSLAIPVPMPIGKFVTTSTVATPGTPGDILALLTNTGRTNLARIITDGLSFQLTSFAVGTDGYDKTSVVTVSTATMPNPALADLETHFWPAITIIPPTEPIDMYQQPNLMAQAVLCRVEWNEAIAALGEIGVWATILWSPVPAEIGTDFLFAIAHFPVQAKSVKHTYLYRMIFQF
jgi:hypothetical protein